MREGSSRMQQTTNARLLGWLLAYPASSAQDLASAFNLHPATIYRHLGRWWANGWLERITGYGGDARFLLTPGGTALLAQIIAQDADQLARTWQHGKQAPARLLPRLLTIDRLHTFARLFFQYAPQALARQGHPVVVRWHLMRDWRRRVWATERRPMTAQAQAVLAWTVSGSRSNGVHPWATEQASRERRWHLALLLLESGLCDADLIVERLQALLRSRTLLEREGASDRTSLAPVLILVEHERQAEVWRRAAHLAACREQTHPLVGAIALMSEQENPWQWGWRELATGAHIGLGTHVASLATGTLPPEVQAHLAAVAALLRGCERSNQVTAEASAAAQVGPLKRSVRQHPSSSVTVLQALVPRQQCLLTRLARTSWMTAAEFAAVLTRRPDGKPLAVSSVERLLRDLARQGLVERDLVVQKEEAVWRWHLTAGGLRQVASMHEVSLRQLRRQAERTHWVMSRQAAHQAGVYAVIAAFHQTAQARGAGTITIRWWESGQGAERSYRYHGVQRNLRPDAELEVVLQCEGKGGPPSHLRLWLEYDTGSMNQRDLQRKMAAYRDYWFSREWAAEGLTTLPRLLFIVPHAGQEEHVRRACCDVLAGVRLWVLVTTAAHLQASGPYGPIWRQVFPELAEGERPMRRALWEERRTGERGTYRPSFSGDDVVKDALGRGVLTTCQQARRPGQGSSST